MARRNKATLRTIEPDARHRSRLVQQLINKVMEAGKKSLAEQIVLLGRERRASQWASCPRHSAECS